MTQPGMVTAPNSGVPAALRKRAADAAKGADMSPEDWRGLVGGLLEFLAEEAEEPEHADDAVRQSGKYQVIYEENGVKKTKQINAQSVSEARSKFEAQSNARVVNVFYGDQSLGDEKTTIGEREVQVGDAEPKTLYANRPLKNAAELIAWARKAGFKKTLPPGDLHVTIAFSKTPLAWPEPETDDVAAPNSARSIEKLGNEGAVVLRFESPALAKRWQQLEDAGASWDHPSFKPHITFTMDLGDIDLAKVEPFAGALEFGPEKFQEIGSRGTDWADKARASMIDDISATDSAIRLALDKDSVRETDRDGRLHVAQTNISKADVNPYKGSEIPGWKELGLDPEKIYNLLRPPEELEKAAKSFDGIQFLTRHIPVSADDHKPYDVIGSTGTDAVFEDPYLKNSLTIWPRDAIDDIESEARKELSCGYHYKPDMTPGIFRGKHYDGSMKEIVGNHVALVKDGRAGDEVCVGDSTENLMSKPTRIAAIACRLTAKAIGPLLAMDQKVELMPIFKGLSSKNFDSKKITAALATAMKGKTLAEDVSIDHVAKMLDHVGEAAKADPKSSDESVSEPQHKAMEAAAHGKSTLDIPKSVGAEFSEADKGKTFDAEPMKAFMKEKGMSDDDISHIVSMLPENEKGQDSEEDLEKAKGEDEEEDDAADEDDEKAKKDAIEAENPAKDKDMVTKHGMDAAIKLAVSESGKTLAAKLNKQHREIRDAERRVRPWVGDLAATMSFDSAEKVYEAAFAILAGDGRMMKVPPKEAAPAYDSILEYVPKANEQQRSNSTSSRIAMDSSGMDSLRKIVPDIDRITVEA